MIISWDRVCGLLLLLGVTFLDHYIDVGLITHSLPVAHGAIPNSMEANARVVLSSIEGAPPHKRFLCI